MKVFVTGATGFVGSAVVQELLRAGHQVLGLARSEENVATLKALGAAAHRGSLEDLESLKSGAAQCDGVIHCAFIHDFSKFKEVSEIDQRAIQAIGEALAGSNRPLVVSGGVAIVSPGRLATEDTARSPESTFPRVSEETALALVSRGVRATAVRLPPTVHDRGDHGFVPRLITLAREKGTAAYIGDGANVWPAVHRRDAAVVYRLALEKGVAGARYHAIAEQGVPFKDIASTIGRILHLPVVSKSGQEAAEYFGWFQLFAGINCPASSAKTQEQLGWKPSGIGLLADMDANYA